VGLLSSHRISWRSAGQKALGLHGALQDDRTARVLRVLLLVLIGWTVLHLLLLVPPGLALRNTALASMTFLLLLTYLAALVTLRYCSLVIASSVYLIGSWLVQTACIVFGGGIYTARIVFYLVLPISAAWLLGPWAAVLSGGVCVTCIFALAWLEQFNVPLPTYLQERPFETAAALLQAMVIAIFPVARVLQILQEAFIRSRAAEQMSRQTQVGLEELVRLRTAELKETRDQAQASTCARSAYLANLSHALRSPLNTILLLSDPEWIDPAIPESGRKDLHLIRRSGEELLHLIDEVIDRACIDAAPIALESAPLSNNVPAAPVSSPPRPPSCAASSSI
jgi:signal transduction histidine kinase